MASPGARDSGAAHQSVPAAAVPQDPGTAVTGPGPGPSVAEAARPAVLASLSGYPARVVGCLLGKMCGDVLGASVEGWSPPDVLAAHPEGLDSFSDTVRGYGCYTDDTQMAIALVRSLLDRGGRCDDVHAALSYAAEYGGHRGYGGTAYKILAGIQAHGIDEASIATIGTKYIPGGSFGNGGAMRIAPLGLVYRYAPPDVLRAAVASALRCTHVHPTAIDGAFVVALAAGYLATRVAAPATGPGAASCASASPAAAAAAQPPPMPDGTPSTTDAGAHAAVGIGADGVGRTEEGGGVRSGSGAKGDGGEGGTDGGVATPAGLLDHLLRHRAYLETAEMVDKLLAVQAALRTAPPSKTPHEPWSTYLASPGWAAELRLQEAVTEPFQIRADDAAAAALSALCFHWCCPEDAIVAAVHYGGDTDTIAAITGALAGSLHGVSWLPLRWWGALENGPAGRDEVLQLAVQLASYDTRA